MNQVRLLIISFLFITISCKQNKKVKQDELSKNQLENKKEIRNYINIDNSKFYLLSKDKSGKYFLKKKYFESDMEVFRFEKTGKMYDKTGSAIMEPLEYIVLDKKINNDTILIELQNKWTKKKKSFNFKYDFEKGIIYQLENSKIVKALVDSTFIKSIKTTYIPPCEEFEVDEYEIKDCLDEYVKDEEIRRVKNNDFGWYPRLDCKKYFDKQFCDKLDR